jgi:hypothetical protein
MRLKFPKTGLILMFMVFVSSNSQSIKRYVEGKMLRKNEDRVLESILPMALMKADSFGSVDLSSRRNQNSNELEEMEKRRSNKKISN